MLFLSHHQDLFRLQEKIDRLERLLSNNNRLVVMLRDSLFHYKATLEKGGGANVSSDSAYHQIDKLPGCQSIVQMKDEADRVQVSLA